MSYLDVVSGFLGEVVEGLCIGRRLLPSWHFVVDNLGLVKDVKIRRVRVQFLQIVSVFAFAGLWLKRRTLPSTL